MSKRFLNFLGLLIFGPGHLPGILNGNNHQCRTPSGIVYPVVSATMINPIPIRL